MTRHRAVDPNSRLDIALIARSHGSKAEMTLDEKVQALVLSCRFPTSRAPL